MPDLATGEPVGVGLVRRREHRGAFVSPGSAVMAAGSSPRRATNQERTSGVGAASPANAHPFTCSGAVDPNCVNCVGGARAHASAVLPALSRSGAEPAPRGPQRACPTRRPVALAVVAPHPGRNRANRSSCSVGP